MRSGTSEPVLSRAFRLLDAFDSEADELTLEALCQRTGLSRSTAFRLAGQLTSLGALERSQRGWQLGTRIFELGQLVAREQRLRERSLAHMQDLFAATGETVQLAVLDAGAVLYVEIISGHNRVDTPSRRGGRMPLYCTALGKALLAFSADAGRAHLAAKPELTARTPNTILSVDRLQAELHAVRTEQIAYDREEAAIGLQCVAAPIIGPDGVASAALSVSMPTSGPLSLAEVAPAVRAVARAVSRDRSSYGATRT